MLSIPEQEGTREKWGSWSTSLFDDYSIHKIGFLRPLFFLFSVSIFIIKQACLTTMFPLYSFNQWATLPSQVSHYVPALKTGLQVGLQLKSADYFLNQLFGL